MFPKNTDGADLTVSILVLPETGPMAVYGLYEVMSHVGRFDAGKNWPPVRRLRPRIIARQMEPFPSAIGAPIAPQATIDTQADADLIIICDLELGPTDLPSGRWTQEIAWVQEQLQRGATVCSTCSGSLLLAEAGLLDGKDAASHWTAAGLFRDLYPAVRFRPERILCESGYDGRLMTSGGASAWQELVLYLIGRFCGPTEAARIAKLFLIGDRRDGQLPFAAMAQPRRHEDAIIAGSQTWIADHYAASNPVTRMVEQSGLPERTFKRRFKQATGYAPVDYVQAIRIEEAKQILETSDGGIDDVAADVGYEDPTFFRRLFKRMAGISPAQYRQRFRTRQRRTRHPGG
ncbi:transcriptional regulator [Sinorhizobium sp. A49]|nr:transcriptional regulator [Sinorhizobium sp. A49]